MDVSGWTAWLRALPAVAVVGVGAAVAGATYTFLTLLGAPLWSRLLATIVVLVLGVAGAVVKERADSREKKKAEEEKRGEVAAAEAKWLQAVQDCLLWPLPQIRDIDPYQQLGVAQSQLAESYTADGELVPPYVDRDIDQTARKRLQSDGLVLLVGTPASGVTRTAYQLVLTVPTSPLILVSASPHGLTTALGELDVLSRLAPGTRLLLWLDRVDTFTKGGLTATMLRRVRERSPGLRVVATISSIRYEVWATENRSVADAFGDPVRLERLPSVEELGRAEAAYPGVDFSEGIAAAFTTTATLMTRKNGGDHCCQYEPAGDECALAQAVVEIVLEWAATDIRRPCPVDRLAALAQQQPGGRHRIEPEHLAGALKWAASPIVGGASLLTLATDCQGEQAVDAHPAIVEIRRAEKKGPAEAVWTAVLEAAGTANDSEAVGRIGFRAHTEGNVSTAARAWAMVTAIDDPATQWLRQAAEFSRGQRDPTAELPPRNRLLELTEAAHGPDHPEVAATLTNLGNAWSDLGQPAKARELHERALRICEGKTGSDHLVVAGILTNLGNAWMNLGQPAKARELFERALRICEGKTGSDHLVVAGILTNLGNAWIALGQPAKARELFERALRINEREFGPDHPQVGDILTNLGSAWNELGQPAKARELHERALRINEREFGPDHPLVARILINLGSAWIALGQPAKARELYERALRINEREFGPDHPQVAGILANLGSAWSDLGQPAKARELYERALRINEREFGLDHPQVAPILTNLGHVWRKLGSRPRPASCMSRRCASTSGSSAPTTPRSGTSSPVWASRGLIWGSRLGPASCLSGRCASSTRIFQVVTRRSTCWPA